MAEWFFMGGYGAFVWPAYGLSILALAGLSFWSWRTYLTAKRRAREFEEGLEK